MFEIFTIRAKKVLELGKSQAKLDGDDCVGTQHILLGLIKESSGIGHYILTNNGLTLPLVLKEIEKVVQKGNGAAENPTFTPRAKKIFEYAIEEATALGHRYIGTEHLLLGLLKEQESVAIQILKNFGLNIEQLRKETFNLLGFYDKNFVLQPTTEENIFSVIAKDLMGEEVIGRYSAEPDELYFNRPVPIIEIQRIIESVRKSDDKK